MRRRLLSILLVLCLGLVALPIAIGAENYGVLALETEGDYEYRTSPLSGSPGAFYAVIDTYLGGGGDIVIPDTLGGYPVGTITLGAFMGSNITGVVIPEGVTNIDGAFVGCGDLESVTLPKTLTNIGSLTFAECTSLKTIELPDGLKSIRDTAFLGAGLTDITIPPSVTSIGWYAFFDCHDLTSIYFEGAPPKVGDDGYEDMGAPDDCVVYYPQRLKDLWAPSGETTWKGLAIEGYSDVSTVWGDANEDGAVNAGDAAFILRVLVRLDTWKSSQGKTNAKVTGGSGDPSAADAAFILRFLVRLEAELDPNKRS